MWGKKSRVYYHGIPLFCASCFTIGHARLDCGETATWKEYINRLSKNGIPTELFGTWLTSFSNTRESQQNIPQPEFDKQDSDSDSDIDFSNVPPKFLKLFKKLQSSTPKSKTKSKTQTKAKPKPDQNRSRVRGRGRGRGGRGTNTKAQPKGRGRN